jgi:hypothetical protein
MRSLVFGLALGCACISAAAAYAQDGCALDPAPAVAAKPRLSKATNAGVHAPTAHRPIRHRVAPRRASLAPKSAFAATMSATPANGAKCSGDASSGLAGPPPAATAAEHPGPPPAGTLPPGSMTNALQSAALYSPMRGGYTPMAVAAVTAFSPAVLPTFALNPTVQSSGASHAVSVDSAIAANPGPTDITRPLDGSLPPESSLSSDVAAPLDPLPNSVLATMGAPNGDVGVSVAEPAALSVFAAAFCLVARALRSRGKSA